MGTTARPTITTVLLLFLALAVAACGARVSPEQVATVGPAASSAQPLPAGGPGVETPSLRLEEAGSAITGEAGSAVAEESTSGGDVNPSRPTSGPTAAGNASPGAGSGSRTASDVGITPDGIMLGHVTQLSGPVPGLFEGSAIGINAAVAYLNSKGGLAGRKLTVDIRDDQFDATQHRNQTRELIDRSFALVGGISLMDDSAAADVQQSGIPDLTVAISRARADIPNNFAPGPNVDGAPTGQFLYFKEKHPEAVKAVGSIYGDVPAGKRVHLNYRAAAESLGYEWKYDRGYQPTETDFTADIIRMRQSGVRAVFMMAVDAKNVARFLNAAHQQDWKPDVWMMGSSSYDRALLTLAGPASEGIQIFLPTALFQGEDAGRIPEVKLFNEWVQRVRPNWTPDTYAASAWMAARLLEQAIAEAGPNPTRQSVNEVLRSVTAFDAHGMQADTGPGVKRPATCYVIAEVKGEKFRRVHPPAGGFECGGAFWRP